MPWVTYTDPELAHVGLTERRGARASTAPRCAPSARPFNDVDRAHRRWHTHGHGEARHRPTVGHPAGATCWARRRRHDRGDRPRGAAWHVGECAGQSLVHPYPTMPEATARRPRGRTRRGSPGGAQGHAAMVRATVTRAERPTLSIVIPTLDEAPRLGALVRACTTWSRRCAGPWPTELVMRRRRQHRWDGSRSPSLGACVVEAPRGPRLAAARGGAAAARRESLLFLHADVRLSPVAAVRAALAAPGIARLVVPPAHRRAPPGPFAWSSGARTRARAVLRFPMATRACSCTVTVRRRRRLPDVPLMEDVLIVRADPAPRPPRRCRSGAGERRAAGSATACCVARSTTGPS